MASPPSTDRKARFLELLEPLHLRLNRFARAMTRDREDARDLVAETVMVAYEGFDRLNDHAAFLSYLFTTARRIAARKYSRGGRFDPLDQGAAEQITSSNTSPDSGPDIELLYSALAMLPETQREAVVLFELSDLSLEEIRQIQGGTLSGVKARVARGRRRLAEILEDDPNVEAPSADAGNQESADASSRRKS